MAQVFLPPTLKDLTGGHTSLMVAGENVGQIIRELDQQFPGVQDRLCPGGQLRPGLAVVVDGRICPLGLLQRIGAASEIHFLPALGGG